MNGAPVPDIVDLIRLRELDPLLADKILAPAVPGGCWIWKGYVNAYGHGEVMRTDKQYGSCKRRVHRRAGRLLRWPDLPEMPGRGSVETLDHLCRVPRCCNPWHLERVTRRENIIVGKVSRLGVTASRYVGVKQKPRGRPWEAVITVDRRGHYLGCFDIEEDAALAYDAACILVGISRQNVELGDPSEDQIADARRRLIARGVIAATVVPIQLELFNLEVAS